jgi:hypothetical protein
MNRYAIIENGLVTNVVVADAQIAAEKGWVQCDYGGPGWAYADGVFTEPVRIEPHAPPKPTKEQLMDELATLTAKIQALE